MAEAARTHGLTVAEVEDWRDRFLLGAENALRARPKDEEALKEWRPLAEQGNAAAQIMLGLMYAKGRGVPQDYVQACMWLTLAAAQGIERARKLRDVLAKRMTPAQLADAQRMAREWTPNSVK